ncbi:hypothetical protein BC826DRAFT_1028346 [Russula brevipes]|nr:hypothetical protein BC826DRAFT_1028346 [Russula brevipes]
MTVLLATSFEPGAVPLKGTKPGDAKPTTDGDTPDGYANEKSSPKSEPEEKSMPPNLEAFISRECLPDIIDVYDKYTLWGWCPSLRLDCWDDFIARYPISFVREYPPRTPTNKDCPNRGQLDLRCSKYLGSGNHSKVVLAPLTLPSTAAAPSVRGAVAVKLAREGRSERDMLLNEAKIYNAFASSLHEGCYSHGLPIVPKFYGYYVPSLGTLKYDDDKLTEEDWKTVQQLLRHITPILLLEPCGKQIDPDRLSSESRTQMMTLFRHLHGVNVVQGSVYPRNILVQPGPLTLPCARRSLDEPSYRIIDFGRAECLDENCESIEELCADERDAFRRHMPLPT